jgi:RND family efflux transporter MFP subunit
MTSGCKKEVTPEKQPIRVRVEKVEPVCTSNGREFSGTVEEMTGTTLSFPVAGTIQRICVENGQRVQKGELIASLDDTSLRNAYNMAAATLEQAEDAYTRLKQLHDNNSLPEIQWVEVLSKLKQAQSAESISKKNLSDSKLYAPVSGIIASKDVEVGQNVLPGLTVVKIASVAQVKVKVSIPENEISNVHIGDPVEIVVSALDGKHFIGKVSEKSITANPLSRSYDVKALVQNPNSELMPGMICTINIPNGEDAEYIMLPTNVIQLSETNRNFVWINKNGKAEKRYVEIGTLTHDGVIVTSGLSAGDEVLVEGQQKVSENSDITLVR